MVRKNILPAKILDAMQSTSLNLRASAGSSNQYQWEQCPFDFTIECADGTVHAHGSILMASSDYFKALLSGSMVESKSRKVYLKHISLVDMTKIIDFSYERPVDLDAESALSLLITARYLQVHKLFTKCLGVVKAHLTFNSVLEIHRFAKQYCLIDLREVVFSYMTKNIVSLMAIDQFLYDLDANLLRALLESDELSVPDEDFVFNFFKAWFNRDREARVEYVNEFKELIRFPFLKVATVATLEETFGPIKFLLEFRKAEEHHEANVRRCGDALMDLFRFAFLSTTCLGVRLKETLGSAIGLDEPAKIGRNLQLSAFRRRRYTQTHCHFLWQQENHDTPHPHRLVLTCNVLGESQKVLMHGKWMQMPRLEDVVASGHTLYSRTCKSIHSYRANNSKIHINAKHDSLLKPEQIYKVRNVQQEYPFRLCATKGGVLHMISNPRSPTIHVLNTTTGQFRRLKTTNSRIGTQPFIIDSGDKHLSDQLIFDEFNKCFIDPVTGALETPSNPPLAKDGIRWYSATQRGDTVFLWYGSYKTKNHFMSALSLSTGQWSGVIEVRDRNIALGHTNSLVIQGRVYAIVKFREYHRWRVIKRITIHMLDEENGVFQRVQELSFRNSCLVGMAPVDAAPPCSMDTWLSAEIRKLPDETPSQRALIKQLREIV